MLDLLDTKTELYIMVDNTFKQISPVSALKGNT